MLLGTEIPCYSVAYASGESLIYRCLCQRKIFDIPLLMPAEIPCYSVAYASGKSLIYRCLCQRKIFDIPLLMPAENIAPSFLQAAEIPGSCSMSSEGRRSCVDICSICNPDAGQC